MSRQEQEIPDTIKGVLSKMAEVGTSAHWNYLQWDPSTESYEYFGVGHDESRIPETAIHRNYYHNGQVIDTINGIKLVHSDNPEDVNGVYESIPYKVLEP